MPPPTGEAAGASATTVAVNGIRPPAALNVTDSPVENWKLWRQEWSNYSIIMELDNKPEPYKKAMFLHCIGSDALKIHNTFNFSNDALLKDILDKLETFFIGEVNETYERYLFNQRNQQEGETVDTYITALKTLSRTCNL